MAAPNRMGFRPPSCSIGNGVVETRGEAFGVARDTGREEGDGEAPGILPGPTRRADHFIIGVGGEKQGRKVGLGILGT